jgi:hypothetical protein
LEIICISWHIVKSLDLIVEEFCLAVASDLHTLLSRDSGTWCESISNRPGFVHRCTLIDFGVDCIHEDDELSSSDDALGLTD